MNILIGTPRIRVRAYSLGLTSMAEHQGIELSLSIAIQFFRQCDLFLYNETPTRECHISGTCKIPILSRTRSKIRNCRHSLIKRVSQRRPQKKRGGMHTIYGYSLISSRLVGCTLGNFSNHLPWPPLEFAG